MSFSVEDYKQQLKTLLPTGHLWTLLKDSVLFDKLLEAAAAEYARINGRSDLLVNETDPRSVLELLTEYESFAGLPDACIGAQDTLSQRRDLLQFKLTNLGGQSRQFYIDLSTKLGFSISIYEYKQHTVGMAVNHAVNGEDWNYVWQVDQLLSGLDTLTVSEPIEELASWDVNSNIESKTVMSGVNEPLATWGKDVIECIIRRLKPAHTHVIFTYQLGL